MKILTKKKADEILLRICANEIMVIGHVHNTDALTKIFENNAEIAYRVGGIRGMAKVKNTVSNFFGERSNHERSV